MAIIPKFYINSITSIGIRTPSSIEWYGTGFFILRMTNKDEARPMLVTNKHVLENKTSIVLRVRKQNSDNFETLDADLFENGIQLYKTHSNDKIDIAVLPLNGSFFEMHNLEHSFFDIDNINNAMSSTELRNEGVDEGSLVHMLGFPMGLVNVNSTTLICRLGCVSRIGQVQIQESYNVLIDIQNFPGNSGSPIITRPELVSISETQFVKGVFCEKL